MILVGSGFTAAARGYEGFQKIKFLPWTMDEYKQAIGQLKEQINTLMKTKSHIQDQMNKKIKDIDHKISIMMEFQAKISACYIGLPNGNMT